MDQPNLKLLITILILFRRPLWFDSFDFCYLSFVFFFADTTWLFFLNLRWPFSLVFRLKTGSSYPGVLLSSKSDMNAKLNLLSWVRPVKGNGLKVRGAAWSWENTRAVETILLNVIISIYINILQLNQYRSRQLNH